MSNDGVCPLCIDGSACGAAVQAPGCPLVCAFCGAPGALDVHEEDGYPSRPCCADEEACRERFDALNAAPAPLEILPCPRCGQLAAPGDGTVCATCRAGEQEPQGTAMHLFTPAPAPIAGSMTLFA